MHAGAAHATGGNVRESRRATILTKSILYVPRRRHHRIPGRLYGNGQIVKHVLATYQTVLGGTLYGRPNVPLDLKIQMVEAEVVETLMCGCVT